MSAGIEVVLYECMDYSIGEEYKDYDLEEEADVTMANYAQEHLREPHCNVMYILLMTLSFFSKLMYSIKQDKVIW